MDTLVDGELVVDVDPRTQRVSLLFSFQSFKFF